MVMKSERGRKPRLPGAREGQSLCLSAKTVHYEKNMPIIRGCLLLLALVTCVPSASSPVSAADRASAAGPPGILTLELRRRAESVKGSGQIQVVTRTVQWETKKTAIIICDLWNMHSCAAAERRTGELAAPVNAVIKVARTKGVFIIHCPSTVMQACQDTPQRQRAQAAPLAKAPVPFRFREDPSGGAKPAADSTP